MSYEKVTQASGVVVGTKQTIKALRAGEIKELVVADDADGHILDEVLALAQQNNVPVCRVDSMDKLGKACGIDVGASAVAIKLNG
ncbi:MAG TPA: 50S ribosomal protein L7ae-like protein [Bacillales bacterium]|nr:50S ribosomal protein L7ae-like protein [Bacillales bacterium]